MPVSKRAYAVAHFGLELDGQKAGFLRSAEGGAAVGTVVLEQLGPDHIQKKHLSNVSWDPITFEVGSGMGNELQDWLQSTMSGKHVRKDGAILEYDANYQPLEIREFKQALITEITFPGLDGSSKEPAYLTVKIAPERTQLRKPGGKPDPQPATKTRQWLTSNFRLEVDGIDCTGVMQIESFTWKQVMADSPIGERREYEVVPALIEVPNLKFTLNTVRAQSWQEWHDDFVVKGNCTDDREKKGSIVYLAPNLKTELMRVNLSNLGIFKLAREHTAGGAEAIPRLVADLYCERMELKLDSSVV